MKRLAFLSLLVLVSASAVAVAQPAAAQPAKPAPPVKAKVINITEGDDIIGDRPTGELVPIGIRDMASSSSLLRIRQDFIDLILKSAEQV